MYGGDGGQTEQRITFFYDFNLFTDLSLGGCFFLPGANITRCASVRHFRLTEHLLPDRTALWYLTTTGKVSASAERGKK